MKRWSSWTLATLFGAWLAGTAGNRFITPARHPDATTAEAVGVALQGLAGLALAVWAHRRSRAEARTPARGAADLPLLADGMLERLDRERAGASPARDAADARRDG